MNFREVLLQLAHHRVEFLVVGGVAATLRGAPLSTFDLDIVHRRSDENIARLLVALETMEARYRDLTGRSIAPTASALKSDGHHLMRTKFGPLDVLGTMLETETYESLIGRCEPMALNGGSVQVLTIDALIDVKRRLGRPKDLLAVQILDAFRRRA